MKKKFLNEILPLNLQFFAETDVDETEVDETQDGEVEDDDQTDSGKERTFTQKEVTAMMAREKKQGKKSVLKGLGFETEEDAKNALNLLKALTDSQKTDSQKADDKKNEALKEKEVVEKRAIEAENKLACFTAGVNKDCISDVLAIATSKLDGDNELSDVLEEMKKESRYSI